MLCVYEYNKEYIYCAGHNKGIPVIKQQVHWDESCHKGMSLLIMISTSSELQPFYLTSQLTHAHPHNLADAKLTGAPTWGQSYTYKSFTFPWWRHQMETFSRYWPFVKRNHRSPVDSLHKGKWHGALMFSLISAWTAPGISATFADKTKLDKTLLYIENNKN